MKTIQHKYFHFYHVQQTRLRVDNAHGVGKSSTGPPACHNDKRCTLFIETTFLAKIYRILDTQIDVFWPIPRVGWCWFFDDAREAAAMEMHLASDSSVTGYHDDWSQWPETCDKCCRPAGKSNKDNYCSANILSCECKEVVTDILAKTSFYLDVRLPNFKMK